VVTILTLLYVNSFLDRAWVAVSFMRTHGMSPGQVGTLIGPAITVGGIAGVLSGSFWCTWLTRRGYQDSALRTAIHALIVAIPLGVIAPLLDDRELALPAITALIFFLTFPQGTNVAAFQPNHTEPDAGPGVDRVPAGNECLRAGPGRHHGGAAD
jgi:hypothetical protein